MRYSLHLTTRCNLACRYCYENEERKLGEFMASEQDLITAINAVPSDASLEILGGEPFLVEDLLVKATELAAGKGITDIMITTNGMISSESIDAYILKYQPTIVVSIDPPRSAPAFRRGVDVEKVCENIEHWNSMTKVVVNMTIHPGNVEEMEIAFAIFARSYRIATIHFGAVEEWFNKIPSTWNQYVDQGKKIIDSMTDEELASISLQPWDSLCYFDKEYLMKDGHEVLEIYKIADEREPTNFERARTVLHEHLNERKRKRGIITSLSPILHIGA